MITSWRPASATLAIACVLVAGSGCIPVPNAGSGAIPESVPEFNAATFTNPTQIDNPFFPQTPGSTSTYQTETEDGTEVIIVEVLEDTRNVMGFTCRVVRDRVSGRRSD